MNDSEQNGSKHSPYLVCSYFLRECNSDLLLLFPNIELCHSEMKTQQNKNISRICIKTNLRKGT
jgi:hypothetical protein